VKPARGTHKQDHAAVSTTYEGECREINVCWRNQRIRLQKNFNPVNTSRKGGLPADLLEYRGMLLLGRVSSMTDVRQTFLTIASGKLIAVST
jgi:hypothetical protein